MFVFEDVEAFLNDSTQIDFVFKCEKEKVPVFI